MKSTAASVESSLSSAFSGYAASASEIKAVHRATRQQIKDDLRRSDAAKKEDLEALTRDTRAKLDALRGQQDVFEKGIRDKVESELNGGRPTDAASVLLRRDASQRVRGITDKAEAASMLRDAIQDRDEELAHSLGALARNRIRPDLAGEYEAAFPAAAESAAALAYIDSATSGGARNLAMGATYAMPLE